MNAELQCFAMVGFAVGLVVGVFAFAAFQAILRMLEPRQ